MNETPDNPVNESKVPSPIATVFTAQREMAIALRVSTTATRIEKLRRLEAAVLDHHDAITGALAADLHRVIVARLRHLRFVAAVDPHGFVDALHLALENFLVGINLLADPVRLDQLRKIRIASHEHWIPR